MSFSIKQSIEKIQHADSVAKPNNKEKKSTVGYLSSSFLTDSTIKPTPSTNKPRTSGLRMQPTRSGQSDLF